MAPLTFIQRLGSQLTERRMRTHALLLAICLWSLYAADLATPGLRDRFDMLKGADFLHFYTLGALANRGEGHLLYDMAGQARLIPALVPEAAGLTYVPLYGPQVSLAFAPLARLSYPQALITWWMISAALYAASCYLIWKSCPQLRSRRLTVLVAALAYPPFFALIAWGQSSAPGLLAFALAYLGLRRGRRFLAGLAIGLLAFKPTLAVGAAIVFLAAAEWHIVAGALLSGTAQIAVGWWRFGTAVMNDYFNALLTAPQHFAYVEPKVYMVHSLRAFWAMLLPPTPALVLYLTSAAAVLAMATMLWRSSAPLKLKYSGLLLATTLVAPHMTVYDLVIVAPAFLLLTEWNLAEPDSQPSATVSVLLYLCYALPLLGPLARWSHLQFSVLAFAALLYWLSAVAVRAKDAPADA